MSNDAAFALAFVRRAAEDFGALYSGLNDAPMGDDRLLAATERTAFLLPEGVEFIRTASYRASGPTRTNIWYDNRWNFL